VDLAAQLASRTIVARILLIVCRHRLRAHLDAAPRRARGRRPPRGRGPRRRHADTPPRVGHGASRADGAQRARGSGRSSQRLARFAARVPGRDPTEETLPWPLSPPYRHTLS
jgi:hypothetical protein